MEGLIHAGLCRHSKLIIGLLAVILVVRSLGQAFVPLMHQEAYYWMYAQHPSLSYFDHPPMVAWMIGLGTHLFGNTEFGVRFVGGVLMILNGLLMYHFARLWWSRTIAMASAILIEASPVYFGLGFLATMDAALVTFWLVSMIGFSHAVQRGKAWGWYLCGFGFGGALLSKYTGVFLLPSVGLAILAHRPWRKQVLNPHAYLAVLLGVAMFWPVLVWNWQHDWASFRFQFLSRFDIAESAHKHPMLEFLGEQVAVATPVILVGAVLIFWRAGKRRRWRGRDKLAVAFVVPLLASVINKAWAYPIHINWTVPAYLALMPAALQAARVRMRAKAVWPVWAWRGGAETTTVVVCSAVNVGLVLFLVFIQPHKPTSMRLFGPWDQLAGLVEHYEDDLQKQTGQEPLVIADGKYELASLMAFYRNRIDAKDKPADTTVNQMMFGDTALGYAYWFNRDKMRGKDCVFVDDDLDTNVRLAGQFQSVRVVWTGRASNGKTYCISECRNFLDPAKNSLASAAH